MNLNVPIANDGEGKSSLIYLRALIVDEGTAQLYTCRVYAREEWGERITRERRTLVLYIRMRST